MARLRQIWSYVPLFGALVGAKRSSHKSAVYELVVSTSFSTLPIWFFPIISYLFIDTAYSLTQNVILSVGQGEFYIYAAALIGPLIFSITKNYAEWGEENPSPNSSRIGRLTFEFPYGNWFFLISIIICMIAAISFGLLRFSVIGLITAKFNQDNMLLVSLVLYVFSLSCLYAVAVYRNELQDLSGRDIGGTREFVHAWNKRND